MPYIITSKTRRYATEKPPVGSNVNWSNPLTRNLCGAWLMNEGGGNYIKNIARNSIDLCSSTSWKMSPEGLALQNTAASVVVNTGTRLPKTDKLTYFCIRYTATAGGGTLGRIFQRDTSSVGTEARVFNTSSTFPIAMVIDTSGTSLNCTSPILGLQNNISTLCCSWDGSLSMANQKLFCNGNFLTTNNGSAHDGNGTPLDDTNGILYIFNRANVQRNWDGYSVLEYFWNRDLSFAEIRALYAAPYQFIAAPRTRCIIPFGAAYTGTLYTQDCSESITSSDTPNRLFRGNRLFSDAVTSSDAINRLSKLLRTYSESITSSDSISRLSKLLRTYADSMTSSDAVLRPLKINRILSDSLTSSDALIRVLIARRLFAESLTASDALAKGLKALRTIAEALTISDAETHVFTHSGTFTVSLLEAMTISDTLTRASKLIEILTDLATAADTIARAAKLNKTVADAMNASTDVSTTAPPPGGPAQTLSLSDLIYIYDTIFVWCTQNAKNSPTWSPSATGTGSWTDISSSSGLWTRLDT